MGTTVLVGQWDGGMEASIPAMAVDVAGSLHRRGVDSEGILARMGDRRGASDHAAARYNA